jgi:two-component system, NarL family, response regulator LiaR
MQTNGTPRRGACKDKPAGKIGVVVVDADPLARRAITETLRRSGRFTVVAAASDGVEGLELGRHYRPELLVTEAVLPRIDGLELTRRLAVAAPQVRVVFLTVSPEDDLAIAALRDGANGVLSKQIDPAALVRALVGVIAGEAAISRRLTTKLVERLRLLPEAGRGVRPIRSPLTTREWEVLDLVAGGATTRGIADTLVLSDETVSSHLKNIRRKLGVSSRAEAVESARQLMGMAVS